MPDSVSTAVLEATDHLVFCAAEDTTLLYANPALLSVLGLSELPAGTSLISTVSPDYAQDLKNAFLTASSSGSLRVETAVNLPSRDTIHLEGSLTKGTLGTDSAIVGIFRDVTDQKRAEDVLSRQAAELMRASESLDRKDQEIAKALEQAKLYQQEHERAVELSKMNEDLEAEVKRRSEAEKTLLVSLVEKEVLLKEIHHRVKNNMQVISSLLNLQMGELKDDLAKKLFEESQSRIRSMSLVHEKLYESDDLASVDFKDYIDSLIRSIFRSYSSQAAGVQLTMEIDALSLPLDQAIPCGLIVNELVCNALKYAFGSGRGRLLVNLKRVGEECLLVVSDNGPGLPDDFDVEKATSLGLRLVNTLVDQIEATLRVDTDEGTCFQVLFPAPSS